MSNSDAWLALMETSSAPPQCKNGYLAKQEDKWPMRKNKVNGLQVEAVMVLFIVAIVQSYPDNIFYRDSRAGVYFCSLNAAYSSWRARSQAAEMETFTTDCPVVRKDCRSVPARNPSKTI
jgi:hypothetical protein